MGYWLNLVKGLNYEKEIDIALNAMDFQHDSKICALPQDSHISAFHNQMKLPIFVSMVIDRHNAYVSNYHVEIYQNVGKAGTDLSLSPGPNKIMAFMPDWT